MRFSIAPWKYTKSAGAVLLFIVAAVFAPLLSGCIGTGRGQVEQMGKLQ